MAEAAKPRRIIDVSSPGETAPPAASRPVIVSHKPAVQDPMVSDPADSQPSQHIPISDAPTSAGAGTEAPKQPPTPSPEPLPTAEQDDLAQTDVKQIVHDKTYFSPVSQPPHRQGISRALIFVVAVLIAAFGLYFVLAP